MYGVRHTPLSRIKESEKMSIKVYKPTINSRRNMSVTDYSELSKVAPERSLLEPLSKNAGRNSYGRITVRHRGGGNRRKYRVIDFKRDKAGEATVLTLEYDPNRSSHIALIQYADGEKRYILAPVGLKVGVNAHVPHSSHNTTKGAHSGEDPAHPQGPAKGQQGAHMRSAGNAQIAGRGVGVNTAGRGGQLHVRQATPLSLWLKRAYMRSFVYPRASSEMFPQPAWQQ